MWWCHVCRFHIGWFHIGRLDLRRLLDDDYRVWNSWWLNLEFGHRLWWCGLWQGVYLRRLHRELWHGLRWLWCWQSDHWLWHLDNLRWRRHWDLRLNDRWSHDHRLRDPWWLHIW